MMKRPIWMLALIAATPFAMGAKGGCGGAINSTSPAPDVAGTWGVSYEQAMEIDVKIGGAVYHKSLPNNGGAFVIDHQGKPISFNLDCSKPEVVCPSEVWPAQVTIDQREPMYPHRMWVKIPVQKCSGQQVAPDPKTCGAGTLNPDCKPVCNGTVTTESADAFGVITEDGKAFDLLLGGGVATNGLNCVLLGISTAHASLVTTGAASTDDWEATAMSAGAIKTGYAGGCLWVGDPNMDGQTAAIVVGASVEISTKFTGARK